MDISVVHNENENRFEAHISGHLAVVDYIRGDDGSLTITHTGVPKELEGQGIAGQLTKVMLEYVKNNGLKVRPLCPYTATYIQRHPEYQDLILR